MQVQVLPSPLGADGEDHRDVASAAPAQHLNVNTGVQGGNFVHCNMQETTFNIYNIKKIKAKVLGCVVIFVVLAIGGIIMTVFSCKGVAPEVLWSFVTQTQFTLQCDVMSITVICLSVTGQVENCNQVGNHIMDITVTLHLTFWILKILIKLEITVMDISSCNIYHIPSFFF